MKKENVVIATVAIIAIVIISLFYYLPRNPESEKGTAEVIISLNFGEKIILKKEVKSGESALDALKSVANVSTSYGGSFVSGINGVYGDENKKIAWFYYINGLLANVGASKYVLHPGDLMRWDYHPWGNGLVTYGELADFPEPFRHGYEGKVRKTLILFDSEFENEAEKIYNYLGKFADVELVKNGKINESAKENDNLIVIGNNNSVAKELNEMHEKLGFYYYLKDGKVFDWNGKEYVGGFGELAQSPYNPKGNWACENSVLLISGNEDYIQKVVDDLLNGNNGGFWIFEGEGQ